MDAARTAQTHANQAAEVSLWLDSYDDLFSDFDPRPYSKRTLSDDFIVQLRRLSRDRARPGMHLKLLLPENARNREIESVIALRIHEHFEHSTEQLREENSTVNKRGLWLTSSGLLLMLVASYISFRQPAQYYGFLLLTLFEPAGWFMFWFGLDQLFYGRDKRKRELAFHRMMSKAVIDFGAY